MSGQPSDKLHRPKITEDQIIVAVADITTELYRRLDKEKGYGTWLSRHEVLGMLEEEEYEVKKAVHEGTLDDVRKELRDTAVGCIFAIACIDAGHMDW